MDSGINKKAISALGTIADANVGLSTKVPVQRPNHIPFEQVTLNQIKRSIIAECTTAAATANKTATVTNFADFELIPGMDILVYFKAANTANNITLSINDSNAYPIKALGTADQLGNGSIKAGAYKKLTFTGDSFITEAPTISVMNSESALPLNSAAVSTELSSKYYNKQSVDGKFTDKVKLTNYNLISDLGLSPSTASIADVVKKMAYNSVGLFALAGSNSANLMPTGFTNGSLLITKAGSNDNRVHIRFVPNGDVENTEYLGVYHSTTGFSGYKKLVTEGDLASYQPKQWREFARSTTNKVINVENMSNCSEVMVTLQNSNDRVCGTTIAPYIQFQNNALYVCGINGLQSTLSLYGVCTWKSAGQIEFEGTYSQIRLYCR